MPCTPLYVPYKKSAGYAPLDSGAPAATVLTAVSNPAVPPAFTRVQVAPKSVEWYSALACVSQMSPAMLYTGTMAPVLDAGRGLDWFISVQVCPSSAPSAL